MKLSLILTVSGAIAFTASSSYGGWLGGGGLDSASSFVHAVKDNKNYRNKHEKKQAKKQKEREKDAATGSTPQQAGGEQGTESMGWMYLNLDKEPN